MARERGVAPNRTLARSLAEAHRMLFQYRRAEEISRDAAEADPAWAPHAYDLALVCELQSRLKDARFWYEESLRRDRSYAAPHMKLARLALDAGERARAREHLDQFDALTREKAAEVGAPRRPDVESEIAAGSGAYWLAVGESHEKEGDAIGAKVAYGRAREALLRALEHSPSCMRALTLLIRVGALLGEDAETLARWKRTLDALRERRSVEPASVDAARTFC